MKLKTLKKVKKVLTRASGPFRWIWPNTSEALIGIVCIFLVAFSLLTYSSEVSQYTSKLVTGNKYLALLEGFFNPFRNKHLLLNSGLPVYDLRIKHQQFSMIEGVAKKARKQGWMSDDLKVWANAKFLHEGRSYNVKVRLRGDLPRHWSGPKKSWRIKFGRQEIIDANGESRREPIYFDRMRQINLIVPIDRDFILAKFINSLMREKDLLVPRDDFIVLRINGVIQGLYYQIEHFDKPLMAFQGRPETTVFGQNDRAKHFEQYTKYGTPVTSDARFDLGSMRRQVDRDGELAMQAMDVLIKHSLNPTKENFRRARAVLDWEKYLYFRITTTLCNTNHVRFGSDNLRLYYDPSRGLLEPIPWDVHLVKMPKEPGTVDFWNTKGPDQLQLATLTDPELRLQRNKMLWQFIGDGGDSLIAKYQKLHDRIRPYAWADVLDTPIGGHKMDELKKNLEYNIRRIHKVMDNSNCNFMYRLESDERAALELTVMNFDGVEFQSVQLRDSLLYEGEYTLFEDSNDNGKLDDADIKVAVASADDDWTLRFSIDKFVSPRVEYDGNLIGGRHWEYLDTKSKKVRYFLTGKLTPAERDPLLWTPPQIEVSARNAVTGYQIPSAFISQSAPLPDNYIGITAYDYSDPFDLDATFLTRQEFLAANPQFKASSLKPGAVALSGNVTITGTIIVPHDVPLVIEPGTDVTMQSRANILSYGGLICIGEPGKRIKIHGPGQGRTFGVVAAVRPADKVVVKYTDFSDASQAQINGTLFTGGFAVHEGDLELANNRFFNMASEDGVNLKNGRIVMTDCEFSNNASDAIDIDFGQGTVANCKFSNIAGDGIDMSGSTITISGCWFDQVADKGISVGEKSNPTLINNLFVGCGIGISIKDLSHAKITYCTFSGNDMAIEAKRKKPMFGGASGEIWNSVFAENGSLLTEDYFSYKKVTVRNSVTDEATEWEASKTTKVIFVAPKQGNYLLAPEVLMSNGFSVSQPDWFTAAGNMRIASPGIFSLFAK